VPIAPSMTRMRERMRRVSKAVRSGCIGRGLVAGWHRQSVEF
jgi:hypothetical protein